MPRFILAGWRLARVLPITLLGSLCLGFTACGGGAPRGMQTAGDSAFLTEPAHLEKGNAETYGTIVENPFRSPLVAPLSTLSAEVNTASYSNVRRFLMEDQLPPRDAVFLAELINYFPYNYPEPAGDDPASLTVNLGPCPWKSEHKLARVGVRARSLAAHEIPRRNLVFLIDVSGSMADENKLPLVQKSIELLLQQLTGADRVAIVTYAGDAGLKLPPTAGSERGRIRSVVRSLRAGGSTNGAGGIQLAYETARRSFINGGANRVILCTDGDFNVGVTSESKLQQLIERERSSGVFLSVLGYGMGNLKNQTLETLANHGNGQYAYIDTLDEARKVFVEQGGTLVCVAKDVKFQVEFNPARVAAYRLIGYENRLLKDEDFQNDAKDAADLGSGHTVTALYEIVPVGVPIELPGVDPLKYQARQPDGTTDEWLTLKMRYKQPDGDKSRELVAVLPAEGDRPTDFRFAAAVAEFGLVLRDSPYKGNANLSSVLERAAGALGADPSGHRREFLDLVRRAAEIRGIEK